MTSGFKNFTVWAIAAALLPTSLAFAQDYDGILRDMESMTEQVYTDVSLPENDELFAGYVNKMFYGGEFASMYGTLARDELNELGQKLYDFLKTKIESVADGELSSTSFTIDDALLNEWGAKVTWTNTELGVESIMDSTDVMMYFWDQFEFDKVFDALLHDCPYELYWYDKTAGTSRACGTKNVIIGTVCTEAIITSPTVRFRVMKSYQPEYGYDKSYPVIDTAKTGAAVNALKNAQAIVDANANLSDYRKLVAYRDEICRLAGYNFNTNGVSYGDPWQLIYVFDGDPSTNVVCEGYSKAFQYLCDISDFSGDVACYSVGGVMQGGTGAGAHMWNIVKMPDGKRYLADITNSDEGTIGMYGELFLVGNPGSIESGYIFKAGGLAISYIYDDETISLWGTDGILNIAQNNYNPFSVIVNVNGFAAYTGEQVKPEVIVMEGDVIVPAEEYSVRYSDNIEAGTATVTVEDSAGGEYNVSGSATFEIRNAEHLETTAEFRDKLAIAKYADNGAAILEIFPNGNGELPVIKQYMAVYDSDGALKFASVVPCEEADGKVVITAPDVEEGEVYKLMLWADTQTPVIEAISDAGFFE